MKTTSDIIVVVMTVIVVISGTEGASLTLTASEPVVSGREVNLTCYSSNTMLSVVEWYRDDTYIGEENYVIPALRDFYSAIVIQHLLSYRLKIFACDYARDNTTWSCQITGSREYLDLHVKVPVSDVTLEVIPANADVVSGENLTFTCTTDPIDPQATIAWYVDGNPETGGSIAHDGPGLVATIGTLIYTTADSDRNHQVYCTAGNVDTVIKSTTTKMDVKIPVRSLTLSVPDQSGSMVTVNAGDELSFKCLTGDIYPQATMVWFVKGSEHTRDTSISDSNTDPIVTTGTLRYTTLSADNNAEVYCTAVSVGSIFTSNKITMDVRYNPPNPPSITDLSSPRIDGVQTTVTCTSIGGNPLGSLTMTCSATGEQGSLSDDGNTVTYVLTLTPTPALDGATCTCTRTGTIGAISSDVGAITVHYSPPSGPVMSGDITTGHLYENDQTIVTCTSDGGNPLGDLTLSCPNAGTIGSSSAGAVTTATLNIASVPRSLNGLACTCDRTNAYETDTKRVSVDASVYYPPSAPSISQPGPWLEKSTQTLTCVVAVPGNPTTHFQWTRGTSIMGNNAVHPFPSVDKSENGATFICTIENDFTVDKQQPIDPAFVILNVQYGPSVSTSGDEFTFTEGDLAIVTTTIDANPVASLFAWIMSDETTAASTDQDLTFNIISRQNAGIYTFSATNYPDAGGSAGMTVNVDITIIVNYAPNVTVSVTDSEVNETAGSVQFTCVATGVPDSYTFLSWKHYIHGTWIRDIPEDTSNIGNGVSTLTLHQLSYETTGRYVCTVHNTIPNVQGQLNQMNGADVTVLGTAKFQTVENVSPELGSRVALSIRFYSKLTVNSYDWTANGNSIVGDNYERNLTNNTEVTLPFYGTDIILDGTEAQLLIQKMGAIDFGTYTLTVVNDIGASSYSLIISGAESPETPNGFKSVSIQHSNVTVSWQSGFNGGSTQKFYLSYKEKASTVYNEETVFDDTESPIKASIQNLKSETIYVFKVQAKNERPENNTSGFAYLEVTTAAEPIVVETTTERNIMPAAVGGGLGAGIVILIVVIVIIVLMRKGVIKMPARNKGKKSSGKDTISLVNQGPESRQGLDNGVAYATVEFTQLSETKNVLSDGEKTQYSEIVLAKNVLQNAANPSEESVHYTEVDVSKKTAREANQEKGENDKNIKDKPSEDAVQYATVDMSKKKKVLKLPKLQPKTKPVKEKKTKANPSEEAVHYTEVDVSKKTARPANQEKGENDKNIKDKPSEDTVQYATVDMSKKKKVLKLPKLQPKTKPVKEKKTKDSTSKTNASAKKEEAKLSAQKKRAIASPYENTDITNGVVSMEGDTPYVNATELTKKTDAAEPVETVYADLDLRRPPVAPKPKTPKETEDATVYAQIDFKKAEQPV